LRGASPGSRRRLARLCLWLAVTSLVLAAARPSIEIEPPSRPGILELVLDTSGSTAAGDIAPTRFAAMQQVATGLLDRIPADLRVGLVGFSSEAATLAGPTTDHDLIRRKVRSQRPTGGTAMGDALQRALDDIQATRPAAPAAVLLLSDGANSDGRDPPGSAQALAAQHIPVLAVAVGTPDGVLHPPAELTTLRPQRVPPDPTQLADIAGRTGGRIVEARSAADLEGAVHSLLRGAGLLTKRQELTMLFVAAALLLLALGAALSRPRRPTPAPQPSPPGPGPQPLEPA
jgi:Ca-activated chloride channel homolog